ncbi:MAG: hypothetical protein DMD79_12880 [Candidatus Rokuibacteriota bacterium]|nr:MAG: hypothetical protein DMD79_12880 [Candidatus Rokubacteria bacterium]
MKHRHGPGFPVMIASVVPPLLVTAWLTLAVLGGAPVPSAAAPGDPVVGAWATYQWTSAVREEVPVLVKQEQPGGEPTWTVTKESAPPLPLFVTYAIVRGDAKTYVLQIVTRQTPEGIPLAVTQITVDRQSGTAVKSVTQRPKGLIATPESGLRPFRQAAVKGATEEVGVAAGRFQAVRAAHPQGTVWVSDQVPAMGLVKATFPNGQLELLRSGTSGAQDLLRS